ncbi:hypothetical protein [Williamsia herbipolensis]|uniref:hypothetical protein n=1 Tax=Williamsia herbipolensis TaxID=1603258 RepID=UPI0005F88155|nr:hypothetical protein [Williamsia herbipolensis]
MSRARGIPRRRIVAAALGLALAVAVMHILVLCGGTAHGDRHTAAGSVASPMTGHHAVMTPSTDHIERVGASTLDCTGHDHGCVFLRGEVIDLIVILGAVTLIAPLARLSGVWIRRRPSVLGRAPPWAIPGHLELSVIVR